VARGTRACRVEIVSTPVEASNNASAARLADGLRLGEPAQPIYSPASCFFRVRVLGGTGASSSEARQVLPGRSASSTAGLRAGQYRGVKSAAFFKSFFEGGDDSWR